LNVSVAFLLEFGLILLVLSVLGTLARRWTLPPVPLYLLAGLLLGDGGLVRVPEAGEFVRIGASIGVALLLLALGLEFSLSEFAAGLRRHVPSAGIDAVLNGLPGAVAGWLLGLDGVGVLALAGATYISSSGIVARLLGDLRRLGNRETPSVLAVLVLEDFSMAAYLPLLAVLVTGGAWWQVVLGVTVAVGVLLAAFAGSYRWGHHVGRVVTHPDAEQVMLRVMGLTLVVAALAESVHASAAVGAFLVGLTLTGEAADRARTVMEPLRDLFAAVFFLAIGLSVNLSDLVPLLPAAVLLAAVTGATKVATGWYAARRDGVGSRGRIRAGTALIARGEFSMIIVGMAGARHTLIPLVSAYVLLLAVCGPLITRFADVRGPGGRGPGGRGAGPASARPNRGAAAPGERGSPKPPPGRRP
jgi:CPA2 family monovalent cation:H+ antiporter-2